jgi:hypothetical protein
VQLPVLNLKEARFECSFGRGCEGICCREGRPPVYEHEAGVITSILSKLELLMRPEAAALVKTQGYLSRRQKAGTYMLRVINGWCVFFNAGCVLHKAGLADGDPFRYKPSACALFPLEHHSKHGWYVRQKGLFGEIWNLFCLDPANTTLPASASLREELELLERTLASEARRKD